MRILHLITGLENGGAEATLFRLIQSSPDLDHLVVSLTTAGRYGTELEDLGFQVLELNLTKSLFGLRRLFQAVNFFEPDLIQSWMYHANLLASLCSFLRPNVPICWGIHHTNLVVGVDPWHTLLASRICAALSNWVPQNVIYVGEKSMELHRQSGYKPQTEMLIPNGYDLSKFVPDLISKQQIRASLDIPHDAFVLGNVGRFAPQKDHPNLLKALALANLPSGKFFCLLVGEKMDHENHELTALATSLGILDSLRFLGPRRDVEKVMNGMDVHVTSSAFGESFPNVICESMACGNPCITTEVGDAAFIAGETGFLAQPGDAESLSSAIYLAYQSHFDRVAWLDRKSAARRRIQDKFSLERMCEAYRSAWIAAISSKKRS